MNTRDAMGMIGLVGLMFGIVAAPLTVVAGSINMDIEVSGDPTHSGSDGVLSTGGTFWNSSYSNSYNLNDEFGTATTIDVVLRQWLGSVTHSGSHALFGDGLSIGSSSAVIYDIRDIDPYKTYDVAVYDQSSYGDAYLVQGTGTMHITATTYNSRTLPGTEGGEYVRFRGAVPYEIVAGQWGVKLYAYGSANAVAGLQIRDTGVTNNIPPYMPTLLSPTNSATGLGLTPTLTANAFNDADVGDTLANSHWQVASNSTFTAMVWDSGTNYVASTSVDLASGLLAPATIYYWRVRYKDSSDHWSQYSTSFVFTTMAGNGAPTNILLSGASVAENLPVGTTAGSFSTQDPDAGNTFTYTLAAGAGSGDNGAFTISGSNLMTAAIFNYEIKSAYSIRVQSEDQGNMSTQKVFSIDVLNVDEPPPSFSEAPSSSGGNMVIRWGNITNKKYTVHCSTNLLSGFSVLQSNISGVAAFNSYTDSLTTATQKYWKVTTDP